MKKIILLFCIVFSYQVDIFSAGMSEKEYFFEEQPLYSISFAKEEVIEKLNKIVFRLTEFRLSIENDIFHIQFRTQPFRELPNQPIFNAGLYNGNRTATFYFNFIFNNENKTITLISGKIFTKIDNFPSDDVFIRSFEINIINYINNEELLYTSTNNRYVNTLFESNQISKIVVGFNLNYHMSWGSRDGDGLQLFTIRNHEVINRLFRLDFLSSIIIIDEEYYWYRFPDIIIAIEYELTEEEKKNILREINNEINSLTKEELDWRPPTSSLEVRSWTKREIFEKQLIDETGPRNFMIHIWKNNEQYICQISDNSIYCLIDINILNAIIRNVIPRTL